MMVAPLIKTVIGLSATSILLAQAAPLPSVGALDGVGRLTLDGALVAAVVALWRALGTKDKQVVDMATKVTETMALVTTAVTELRSTINELKLEYQGLPCAARAEGKLERR